MKQLTVPLLPDPNCSMPENDAQCVIPVKCCISFKTMLCPNFLMVCYAAGLAKKREILIFPRTAGNTGIYWEIRLILNLQIHV